MGSLRSERVPAKEAVHKLWESERFPHKYHSTIRRVIDMRTGTYRQDGKDWRLRGEKALLMECEDNDDMFLAQFDNFDLQEAHGWTRIQKRMFTLPPDE